MTACERELQKRLAERGVYFGDGLLPTYAQAFVVAREHAARWAEQACNLVEAAETAAQSLVTDVEFFEAMRLNRDALELVQVNPGYRRICVLCRPDGLLVGDDMKFVEVNCDSPAMMMFIDVVADCLLELDEFAWLRAYSKPGSAADHLLDTLLECYREYGGTRQPTIAIADWDGQKTRFEHRCLKAHFEARGFTTIVCSPLAFRRVDGELRVDEHRIDLVYRRALTSELIERQDEVKPLLQAYRNGEVCLVNPLRSAIAGAKSVLTHIARRGGADLVPPTVLLDTQDARQLVAASPVKWVLKKSESHGGQDVVLPDAGNEAAWHAALAASKHEVWIAQQYLDVPRLAFAPSDLNGSAPDVKYFNWNPFIFGGRYAGGLVRVSSTPLINITLGGGLLPTFLK
jgi:hypothetical protein